MIKLLSILIPIYFCSAIFPEAKLRNKKKTLIEKISPRKVKVKKKAELLSLEPIKESEQKLSEQETNSGEIKEEGKANKEAEKISVESNKKINSDEDEIQTEKKNDSAKTPSTEIKIDLNEVKVGIFGFIKADFVHSDKAMLSFGRENLTAPNQAKRIVQNDDREPRSLFSMRETSIGFNPKFGKNLESVIQFDLMDINKGNGGPASNPRIVQAYIEYRFSPKLELFAGQKWDIFSPLYPDTYNIISGLLGSGNIGWFREQIGLKHSLTNTLNLKYSLGNPNINISPNVQNKVERSKYPTLAFQLEFIPSDKTKIYFSGIYARLLHNDPNDNSVYLNQKISSNRLFDQRHEADSQGLSFGFARKITSNLELKSEFHHGKNMDNLSLLATSSVKNLNSSTFFPKYKDEYKSITEIGGWLSLKWDINEKWETVLLSGQVKIMNVKDLPFPNNYAANPRFDSFRIPSSDFSLNVTSANETNVWGDSSLGAIIRNSTLGGSIAHKFEGNFKLFFYYQYTETHYKDDKSFSGFGHYFFTTNSTQTRPILQTINYDEGNKPHTHLIRMGAMQTF